MNAVSWDSHSEELLRVKNLSVRYRGTPKDIHAVGGISFSISKSEVFSLVGESGCGKSTTAHAIARLLDEKKTTLGGQVFFDGCDLLALPWSEMTSYRGSRIGMIFQNPLDSLNPLWTAGYQIGEAIRCDGIDSSAALSMTEGLLGEVMIPDPARRTSSYPHELSGGMRQRVMIAMMISRRPSLLIADEPTTALDVTIQSQILDLIRELRRTHQTSILLITHDFGIVADMADRVGVMYAGKLMEVGDVEAIFESPLHPYTQKLMKALPNMPKGERRLEVIQGSVPDMSAPIEGCAFRERCEEAFGRCEKWEGRMIEMGARHLVSCALFSGDGEP
ncbi:MAG: ABC transporter ATP-binding protein [Synergistaceae bacterium]|jgi:oligopeptide/dipeptide ABC transporter ATP-binding protein|nr:ABC transporter ATP-binding protein [Synergistaceae bacterium]